MTPRPSLCVLLVAAAAFCGCGGHESGAPPAVVFHSRPDLSPPPVTVSKRTVAVAPGYLFLAPKKGAQQKGPEIVTDDGSPVWFRPVPAQATDFRVQRYRGRPVLTWWQGPVAAPVRGSGVGHGVLLDTSYRELARVDSGFGADTADLHEFLLTPAGTALLTVFRTVPYDLSSVGGPKRGRVVDGVVQEVDVATGHVLFTWHSIGHVALSESYTRPSGGTAYDYFHVNSVAVEPGGKLLVSARNTHAVYEIDRRTGAVVWRLGGKRSTFSMGAGTSFAWQHDVRRQPDGTITIFDDGAAPAVETRSRALRLRVDLATRTVTLIRSYASPDGILAKSQGNMQVLANGDVLVGWGSVPRVTEFREDGAVVFDAALPKNDDSYRAYRFPWQATPATRPAVAVEDRDGGDVAVFASWNGATAVARWAVLAGSNADNLHAVGPGIRARGFETELDVRASSPLFAVEALDASGRPLGRSAAVGRGGVAIG